MIVSPAGLHVALLVASVLTTGALAVYAWRRRPEPGVTPFVGLMVAFTVYSTAHLVGLLTPDPGWRLFWENVQWIGTVAIPVFWMSFAMEYTGHDELIDRRLTAALSLVPVVTVVLTWTNPWHGLVWSHNAVVVVDGLAILEQEFGPWFWVFTSYTYGLLAVGSLLLARLIWRSEYLYADQSVLLVIGVGVPWTANVFTLFEVVPIRDPALDVTPYAFAVTGLAFGYALFRRRLFDLVPATRQLGRAAAIAQLQDGVVIVDARHTVVYSNETAAEVFGCEPAESLGRSVHSLVDATTLAFEDDDAFEVDDALTEIECDRRTYEVRTSPIRDRRDRLIGHTIVVHDVTERKRRLRQLARQRDELETLNDLNAIIRGVNRALVSATTRSAIEEAVCRRLTDTELFETAYAADVSTWRGDADRWTVAGDAAHEPPVLPALRGDGGRRAVVGSIDPDDEQSEHWTVVPLVHGRTVYGALGLFTGRVDVSERERTVLFELGELIGHAINAVENRQLLSADAALRLEFARTDGGLARAAQAVDGRLSLEGLVPGGADDRVVYLRVEGGDPDRVRDALPGGTVRTVRKDDGADSVLEWRTPGDSLLDSLLEHGASVTEAIADDRGARYVVEVASDADVRALLDYLRGTFPGTRLESKRELERPPEFDGPEEPGARIAPEFTDRQREALEAAYRAGYFHWPRDSTAEEVADALDISPPTLHAHLRKAEESLLAELFEPDPDPE